MSEPLILPAAPESLWLDFQAERGQPMVRHDLIRHWQRSRKLGTTHDGPRPEDALNRGSDLRQRVEQAEPMLVAGRGIIERVSALAASYDYSLLLADPSGVVIDVGGGGAFHDEARRVRLMAGADWSESRRGTNAIGTVVAEGRPVFVEGSAHYARSYHGLVCYASPIHDADGEIIAIIDATSSLERANPAVGFGVIAAAQSIEEVLRIRAFSLAGATVTRALARSLERMSSPVALIEPPGRISRLNGPARKLFGHASPGSDIRELLGFGFEELAHLDGEILELFPGGRKAGKHPGRLMHLRVEPIESGGRLIALLTFFEPAGQARLRPRLPRGSVKNPSRESDDPFRHLFAEDAEARKALRWAAQLAPSDIPIMLFGETGSGKELVAGGIHRASARSEGPFVVVNCASIAPSLLESELFGYGSGAFTGADKNGRHGYLEAASGGTLFLDEVAEMPVAMQATLLRVLDTGSYRRVGETATRHANVRVICATCRPLQSMVEAGEFRDDLYFRLKGAAVTLPPLRHRTDTVALARHLLGAAAVRHNITPGPEFSGAVESLFAAHAWPGNVRELKNTLEVALVVSAGAAEIDVEHLPPELTTGTSTRDEKPGDTLADAQGSLVRQVLGDVSGNVSLAAKRLGVARSTLYRMMRRYGVKPT